jgi:hypothetical protein
MEIEADGSWRTEDLLHLGEACREARQISRCNERRNFASGQWQAREGICPGNQILEIAKKWAFAKTGSVLTRMQKWEGTALAGGCADRAQRYFFQENMRRRRELNAR